MAVRLVLGFVLATLLLLGAAPERTIFAQTIDIAKQRELVNQGTVGIVSGGVTGTYIRIAADLADALDDGYEMRVLPIIGKGSVRNIEDLLLLRGVDVAIVQSDVLDFYRRRNLWPGIDRRIRYITKLYNEEIHLLARDDISSVDDLAGRRVNFGTEGSGTFMTAGIVFDELGLDVEVTTYPEPEALEGLRRGAIDALVFVGGQPLGLVQSVRSDDGMRLLPIPAARVDAAYAPAELTSTAYPQLVPHGQTVPTLAVGAVMAAYNWPVEHPRYRKVSRFIDLLFSDFERLRQPPYHPKWRQVDLTAPVPGWERMMPARRELAAR